MPLYRCNCKILNPKFNNIRKIIVNKIIFKLNKKLLNCNFENINIIIFDSGGLLDEYKIISKIKLYKKAFINIFFIEKELNNKNINSAEKIFIKKIKKKFYKNKINFKKFKNLEINEFLKNTKNNSYNLFLSIDGLPERSNNILNKEDFFKEIKDLNKIKKDYFFDFFSLNILSQKNKKDYPVFFHFYGFKKKEYFSFFNLKVSEIILEVNKSKYLFFQNSLFFEYLNLLCFFLKDYHLFFDLKNHFYSKDLNLSNFYLTENSFLLNPSDPIYNLIDNFQFQKETYLNIKDYLSDLNHFHQEE